MSRRGICHIWFRGRHISPSMPYREARSVAESSEGSTASKSDRTGRNPGMTRLVRRSSATSGGTAILSLVETFRRRMRKCSGSIIIIIYFIKSAMKWSSCQLRHKAIARAEIPG